MRKPDFRGRDDGAIVSWGDWQRIDGLLAHQHLRRDVDASGKYQLQSADHDFAPNRLRNVAGGFQVQRLHDFGPILQSRKHDDGDAGIVLANIGKYQKTIAIGQVEIKKHQA